MVGAWAAGGPATELALPRSTATGPPLRLCTNRHFLHRALALGFTEIGAAGAHQPLVRRDPRRVYLWMTLDPRDVVLPVAGAVRLRPDGPAACVPPPQRPERSPPPMPAPLPNGEGPDPAPPPERWGLAEVIAEAEALRGLLQDASARTGRLLAALRQQRRQSRAVQQAMASLKQLHLDP